jgi:hypothetical protein
MPSQAPEIGVGRALRSARQRLGLTVEEAALGTRLRAEYLDALEREEFQELPGQVYTRSFLRSYGRFLGLNEERVVAAYERGVARARPAPAPVDRAPALVPPDDDELPGVKRHFPWPLAASVAVLVLIAAAAFGLFSRSASTPEPARALVPQAEVLPNTVQVDVVALREVRARIVADGVEKFDGRLDEEEARSFVGQRELSIWLESGQSVELTVNGRKIGSPGDPTDPFAATYTSSHYRGDRSKNG